MTAVYLFRFSGLSDYGQRKSERVFSVFYVFYIVSCYLPQCKMSLVVDDGDVLQPFGTWPKMCKCYRTYVDRFSVVYIVVF